MTNYLRQEHELRMATDPKYRKDIRKDDKAVFGAVAAVAGLAIAAPFIGNHDKQPAPEHQPATQQEHVASHQGQPSTSQPGEGVMHTKSGDFQVKQQ